ncbi:hypothetical protein B0H66DRAFT_641787 [Apodospora peruviana]|uniref:Uncharacterized protein n=1 Tax=Apodospora peruviana TaxID=516989 RepID=A0AAE0M372_9PEZI|nr:hypothetical protein B0H66DRAFT_641787 [Apodospora peruviana]
MSALEPLAILSIACNVMQVIDFSHVVFSTFNQTYNNGSADTNISEVAKHLSELSEDALTTATQKKKLGQSIVSTVKRSWHKRKIEQLEKDMTSIQSTLNTGILVRICKAQDVSALQNRQEFFSLSNAFAAIYLQDRPGPGCAVPVVTPLWGLSRLAKIGRGTPFGTALMKLLSTVDVGDFETQPSFRVIAQVNSSGDSEDSLNVYYEGFVLDSIPGAVEKELRQVANMTLSWDEKDRDEKLDALHVRFNDVARQIMATQSQPYARDEKEYYLWQHKFLKDVLIRTGVIPSKNEYMYTDALQRYMPSKYGTTQRWDGGKYWEGEESGSESDSDSESETMTATGQRKSIGES